MILRQKVTVFLTVFTSALLLMSSQLVLAQNSNANENAQANGNGKVKVKKNIGFGNASNGIKGTLRANKDIVYTGEPLEIGFHFARGSELINGDTPQADAYVVIFAPVSAPAEEPTTGETTTTETTDTTSSSTTTDTTVTDAIVVPVSEEAGPEEYQLFQISEVDLSTLAPGTYQLGLVLTVPLGDPLNINDWYNGLLGLVDVSGLTISGEALEADPDGDGTLDCVQDVPGVCNGETTEETTTTEETGTGGSTTQTETPAS